MSSGSATPSSAIDQALKAPFWRLALPGALEAQFKRDSFHSQLLHTQRSGWLALFIFDCFLLVDWLMANDVFWLSVFLRLAVLTPLGVITLLMSRRLKHAIPGPWHTVGTDLIVLFSGWAAALCLAVILMKSQSPWAFYYHAGFMVVILYGSLVQQISFPFAVLFSAGILTLHLTGLLWTPEFPPGVAVGMGQMMVVTACITLVANYLFEKARRKRYLLLQRDQQLVDDLAGTHLQLQKLSRSDVLTGVANRRHFQDYLQQVWDRLQGDQSPLSLLMLDVDHFKAYNDRYGHPAGDACLKQVAEALEERLRRPGDLVARFGGEEFVIVLPHANLAAARQAGERIRCAIEAMGVPHEASPTSGVLTVSVGVATMVPGQPGSTPDKLVSAADKALYEAKRGRRNRVCAFGEPA